MFDTSPGQLGFEFIRDLCVELITLATGVTAITIAAAERGMLDRLSPRARASIRVGWVLCMVSVGAGILQLMALTGALAPPAGAPVQMPDVPSNARLFGLVQILAFALGMIAMVAFAWKGIPSSRAQVAGVADSRIAGLKVADSPAKANRKARSGKR
jgi:hypothetical protein